jgi:hypothetical protein
MYSQLENIKDLVDGFQLFDAAIVLEIYRPTKLKCYMIWGALDSSPNRKGEEARMNQLLCHLSSTKTKENIQLLLLRFQKLLANMGKILQWWLTPPPHHTSSRKMQ